MSIELCYWREVAPLGQRASGSVRSRPRLPPSTIAPSPTSRTGLRSHLRPQVSPRGAADRRQRHEGHALDSAECSTAAPRHLHSHLAVAARIIARKTQTVRRCCTLHKHREAAGGCIGCQSARIRTTNFAVFRLLKASTFQCLQCWRLIGQVASFGESGPGERVTYPSFYGRIRQRLCESHGETGLFRPPAGEENG